MKPKPQQGKGEDGGESEECRASARAQHVLLSVAVGQSQEYLTSRRPYMHIACSHLLQSVHPPILSLLGSSTLRHSHSLTHLALCWVASPDNEKIMTLTVQ